MNTHVLLQFLPVQVMANLLARIVLHFVSSAPGPSGLPLRIRIRGPHLAAGFPPEELSLLINIDSLRVLVLSSVKPDFGKLLGVHDLRLQEAPQLWLGLVEGGLVVLIVYGLPTVAHG